MQELSYLIFKKIMKGIVIVQTVQAPMTLKILALSKRFKPYHQRGEIFVDSIYDYLKDKKEQKEYR